MKGIYLTQEGKQEGYICPHTKIQCDDECCVSVEDCHLLASIGILSESKQETLEEAKQRVLDSNFMTLNDADIFEMGAKWQAERMYSEEDLREAYMAGKHGGKTQTHYEFQAWFEQLKKR